MLLFSLLQPHLGSRLLLLQTEHPADRVWKQALCCAEAGDQCTGVHGLFVGSRATCGPVASKMNLQAQEELQAAWVGSPRLRGVGLLLKYTGLEFSGSVRK